MTKIFGAFALLCLLSLPARAGAWRYYDTDGVSHVYHRHDHFHHFVSPPAWHYPYRAPHVVTYGHHYLPRPHVRTRARRAGPAPSDNWYYCQSYWRLAENLKRPNAAGTDGRFWWPYYNPRPTTPDPCNYKSEKVEGPRYRPF